MQQLTNPSPAPFTVPTQAGLGNPAYRMRVLSRLMGGIEITRPTGCWLWNHGCSRDGHATVSFQGRLRLAHWVAWILLVAPVPAGVDLVRTCHTRQCSPQRSCRHLRCVNPRHLVPA
jgi:hypothetical protein